MKLEEIIYGRVIDCYKDTTKNNKKVWLINLRSSCGDLKFKFWDYQDDNDDPRFPQKNKILKIRFKNTKAAEEEYAKYKSITLKDDNFIYIEKEELPEFFRKQMYPEAPKERLKKSIEDLASDVFWENSKNHKFVFGCIEYANLNLFKKCPAATTLHHAYKGGLLIHSHEVFENCLSLYEVNKKRSNIDKDVLLASAWLHDIGKTITYSINEKEDNLPECDEQENKVGHSAYSCSIVYGYAVKSQFEDKEFLNKVMHCIVSHHGRKDWGAIVEPKTIEAHILHAADNVSSKLN